MPSLMRFESQKILGMKFLLFLTLLLLAASTAVCFFTVKDQSPYQYGKDTKEVIEKAIKNFRNDPESFAHFEEELRTASFEKTRAVYAEWERAKEASGMGDAYPQIDVIEQKDLFYTCVNGSNVPDQVIEAAYLERVSNAEDFERSVSGILSAAKQNAERLRNEHGSGMDDPLYFYQVYVYRTYEEIRNNVSLYTAPVYGWKTLLEYSYGDMFLFAALILFSSVIFPPEKTSGMLPILRTSKNGRLRTSISNVGTVLVGSFALTVLFCAASFLTVLCTEGYSDPFVPVQNVPSLHLFPAVWTIAGYYGYTLLMKVLSGAAFSLAVAFVSALTYQTALSFAAGALLFGGSFALSFGDLPVFRCFNFVSLAAVTPLTVKLQAFQAFGRCVPYLTAAPLFCAAIIPSFTVLTAAVASNTQKNGKRIKRPRFKAKFNAFTDRVGVLLRSKRKKTYRMGLLAFEARKLILWKPAVLLFAFLMLALQIVFVAVEIKQNETQRSYRVYTSFLLPEIKGRYLENRARFEELLSLYKDPDKGLSTLRAGYKRGKIGKEEYERMKESLTKVRDGALAGDFLFSERLNEHFSTLQEQGKDPYIIDYHSFAALFDSSISFPLYGLILFVCGLSFVIEYAGKNKTDRFVNILRAAKNGRAKTFAAKFVFSALFSCAVSVFFYGVECAALLKDADLTVLNAPLCSLPQFGAAEATLTVSEYLLFFLVLRVLAAVLFALFVTALSQLTKNLLFCLALSSGLTLIPTALAALGMKVAGFISFGGFFSVTEMAKLSMEQNLFSTNFGSFIVFGCSFALLTAILTLYAGKSFMK